MKDPISQLKKLKNNSQAGWISSSESKDARTSLMQAISSSENTQVIYSASDAVAYYRWMLGDLISKPMVAAASIFVLLLGGWMTSVNAASNSLPGDTLYSLKLATEATRLKLASREHRAVLHTEFAQRRYEEVLAISETPEKDVYVAEVLEAFHVQIDLANSNLQQLQNETGEDRVKIATVVDQKIEELTTVIEGAAAQSTDTQDIKEVTVVLESTKEVSDSAVDVIVEAHEEANTQEGSLRLDELFRKEFSELSAREAFDLGRLVVITKTIAENTEAFEGVELPVGEGFNAIQFEIEEATSRTSEAMNVFAAGGHKTAFTILQESDAVLLNIEQRLAFLEITIMDVMSAESARAALEMQEIEETEALKVVEVESEGSIQIENQELEHSLEETQ